MQCKTGEPPVNEHDAFGLTISWQDGDGEPATPESASYRIDDIESGAAIRGETSLDPQSEVTILVAYSDTRILHAENQYERRRLTATARYGTDDDGNPIQNTSEYDYVVRNLGFVE